MSFKDQAWSQRFLGMGELAESAFETWAAENHRVNIVRYGLNRPPINVGKLPTAIRYTPDYLSVDCLWEVQGCGADHTIKLKLDKLEALRQWDRIHPVRLWFWNSKLEEHWEFPIEEWPEGLNVGTFPEGKAYFELRWPDET